MSIGFSQAAVYLQEMEQEATDQLRLAVVFSRSPAYDELHEVWGKCQQPDWDMHGADAVEYDTVWLAENIIEHLPDTCPLPSIGAEPDGLITLEWYRSPSRVLSVSVSPDDTLYYAALLGTEDPRGTCRWEGEVPDTILYLIGRVYDD